MAERNSLDREGEDHSYGHILRDITDSTRDLVRSEVGLVRAEIKSVLPRVARHSRQMVLFGTVCALSIFPFLGFLVLGLGRLLNENYWLSCLLVALVFASVGAPIAIRSLKKIKAEDLNLNRTKQSLRQGSHVVQSSVKEVVDAVKGRGHHGYHH